MNYVSSKAPVWPGDTVTNRHTGESYRVQDTYRRPGTLEWEVLLPQGWVGLDDYDLED